MTRRERMENKAERLREWADKREAKQPALNEAARCDEAKTGIPFGQPILVGHHSERRHRRVIERIDNAMRRAVENTDKMDEMRNRAEGIEMAVDTAIFSDDEDAPERLQARIAELEAKRDGMKAANAAYRKDGESGLAAKCGEAAVKAFAELRRICPYERMPFPSYSLTNLGANIRRQKERLAQIEREKADGPPWRYYSASKYASVCLECDKPIDKGSAIVYRRGTGEVKHFACHT